MKLTWYEGVEITDATPEQMKAEVNALVAEGWEWVWVDLDEGTATLRLVTGTTRGEYSEP